LILTITHHDREGERRNVGSDWSFCFYLFLFWKRKSFGVIHKISIYILVKEMSFRDIILEGKALQIMQEINFESPNLSRIGHFVNSMYLTRTRLIAIIYDCTWSQFNSSWTSSINCNPWHREILVGNHSTKHLWHCNWGKFGPYVILGIFFIFIFGVL